MPRIQHTTLFCIHTFDAVQTQTILTSLQEQENTGEHICKVKLGVKGCGR